MLQIEEPAKVNTMNFGKFILLRPAGIDIISLTPGAILPKIQLLTHVYQTMIQTFLWWTLPHEYTFLT
jgi:hypothetical protein